MFIDSADSPAIRISVTICGGVRPVKEADVGVCVMRLAATPRRGGCPLLECTESRAASRPFVEDEEGAAAR